jgi:hypothetical protein
MNPVVLLLLTTWVPGQAPAASPNNDGNAVSPLQPVGIVVGEHVYGQIYAQTGWPGPPAVSRPSCFARIWACLTGKPKGPPPPPDFFPTGTGGGTGPTLGDGPTVPDGTKSGTKTPVPEKPGLTTDPTTVSSPESPK